LDKDTSEGLSMEGIAPHQKQNTMKRMFIIMTTLLIAISSYAQVEIFTLTKPQLETRIRNQFPNALVTTLDQSIVMMQMGVTALYTFENGNPFMSVLTYIPETASAANTLTESMKENFYFHSLIGGKDMLYVNRNDYNYNCVIEINNKTQLPMLRFFYDD